MPIAQLGMPNSKEFCQTSVYTIGLGRKKINSDRRHQSKSTNASASISSKVTPPKRMQSLKQSRSINYPPSLVLDLPNCHMRPDLALRMMTGEHDSGLTKRAAERVSPLRQCFGLANCWNSRH